MLKRVLQLAILTAVLTSKAENAPPLYTSVLIPGVPHVVEKEDFCGEAAAEMYLRKLGENMDQDYVFDRADVDPVEGRGLDASELAFALARIGFEMGRIWTPIGSDAEMDAAFAALHADLASGVPSIVLMRASPADATEHFHLVLGYEGASDEVVYHDPSIQDGAYRRMSREEFLDLWSIQGRYQWGVVRLRLDPRELEYGDASDANTPADFAQHVMRLRRIVPQGFVVAVEPPFVVVSDAHPVEVEAYAHGTIRRAVALLKKDFFARDPKEIVDIWLFSANQSYTEHTLRVFGESPGTPYGFYSREHRAIVINIATGGGTLVHEIVHPFVAANFPSSPPWLDEGLASLFEYPTSVDGHIRGLVNWRLPTLKAAIALGELPTFEWLTSRTDEQFYGEDPGTNYAEARYICYYLQQRGLLVDFYHAFYEARGEDPTGYRTLLHVLGGGSAEEIEQDWSSWILGLRQAR
ncbi:MAG: C39 family peptidase [Proteobacteria bacterium]|jgi:hypothetical protein|nr:C39 family peptidase [Pseudomonadota bacterium]